MQNLFSRDFTREEFRQRRQKVAEEIGDDSVALLQGGLHGVTGHPSFSQSKVFYYLCGIQIERSYLLIEGENAVTTLFVPPDNICNVAGGALDEQMCRSLCEIAGIDAVKGVAELERALSGFKTAFLLQRPDEEVFATKFGLMGQARLRAADPFDGALRRDELLAENIKKRFPAIEIGDLDPIIGKMRLVKSAAEIELLRRNGKMSAMACMEGMKATSPGVPQTMLHAIADYVFRIEGDCGHSYDFILEPSHPESQTLLDGDLVLMDCAPDHGCYAGDIARMWPVNGVFDAWQRHTYGLIVDYHKTLLRMTKAGAMVGDIYKQAADQMVARYKSDAAAMAILNNMFERGVRYFNHAVGLSTHDAVGPWQETPLQPGMVVVVDPMVWLDDAPHGYVRVEDMIVVTPDGYESLTGAAPFEIDEIEALMKQPGRFPAHLG